MGMHEARALGTKGHAGRATSKSAHEPAELRIPAPWFDLPKSFYRRLAAYTEEFGVSSADFLTQSMDQYARELRARNSPGAKTLGLRVTRQLKKLASEGARNWWSKLTPEQRQARARRANEARWANHNASTSTGKTG